MSILSQQKQSVNTDFPNIRPSLDLRFALAKKLDPRITFTRGSSGTYFGPDGIMRTAGVNEPRFDHDPVTGQSLGLLVEESRQNLLTYSQGSGMNNPNWNSNSGAVIVQTNSITAPDGTLTANKIIAGTTAVLHLFSSNTFSVTSGTTYTFSCFFKPAENSWVYFRTGGTPFSSNGYVFNISNGTLGVAINTLDSVPIITKYPDGWYRISITKTASVSGNGLLQIIVPRGNSTTVYTGDGTSGIYIWGAQVEAGAFPTSYIPTTASTVTRSADKPNILDISSFFNSTEGTLFVDSEIPYQTNAKFPSIGFTRGSTAGSPNSINFYYYNTSTPNVTFLVRNTAAGGGFGGQLAHNLIESASPNQIVGVYKKFVGTYKFGELNYYFDGKFVAKTNTNKALPTNLTYMEIGTNAATDNRLNGHIRRITYYPIQLTNQQLINLTN